MMRFLIFLFLLNGPLQAEVLSLGPQEEEVEKPTQVHVVKETVEKSSNDEKEGHEEEVGLVLIDSTNENSEDHNPELNYQNQAVLSYEGEVTKRPSWLLSTRYLGLLSQMGVEKSLFNQFSLGLFYGRYQGKVAGADQNAFIPGFYNVALQGSVYLNQEKVAFASGPVLRFSVHANKQDANELVQSIQVDGQDIIRPGETRIGTLLGIGYVWNWRMLSLSVGMEYLSLGPLKNLVPLALGVGVTF